MRDRNNSESHAVAEISPLEADVANALSFELVYSEVGSEGRRRSVMYTITVVAIGRHCKDDRGLQIIHLAYTGSG